MKISQTFLTDLSGKAHGVIKAKKLQLWSPENPKLYKVTIKNGSEIVDDEIGFRSIRTEGKKILLNNREIFLCGISMHEEKFNGGGRANSLEDAKTLLKEVKDLGCNFVRLILFVRRKDKVSWFGRKFLSIGQLLGQILKRCQMQKINFQK